jgi:glycosyltransferase involved in cell wall biosynthesis
MSDLPKISIIAPTLNNEKILSYFLDNLIKQDYPKNKLEILIVDGGSKDKTLDIAKKYPVQILHNKLVLAEAAVDMGLRIGEGELLIVLATDNIFKQPYALKTIADIFSDNTIYAAFPKHDSAAWDSIYTKYENVFTDPFNHFVYGYAANSRTFKNVYKTIEHNNVYDIYDFSSSAVSPMIAFAQGFTIRKSFMRSEKDKMDDIKPVLTLIEQKKRMAYIHSISLYHHTIRDADHFVRKTIWATKNALQRKNYGIAYRSKYLSKWQKIKLKIWPIYALSFVLPTLRALYGLIVDREPMWLYHPYMCFLSAYASVRAVIMLQFNRNEKVNRQ